jgi:L-ascorbate metabolism protein UlaG (beta-lactamase superfamily)
VISRGQAARGALLLVSAGGVGLAAWVGWLSPVPSWEVATGWSEIPVEERPPSASDPPFASDPPRLHWLGHSGFLIEWHGRRMLIDPNTSTRCTVARRMMPLPLDASRLGAIDAALISHAHYDHLDMPTLRRLSRLDAVVLPLGSETYFTPTDWPRVEFVPLRAGQGWRLDPLEIVAVSAAHHGSRLHPLASRRLALGYVIRHGDDALYYSGDTGFGEHFQHVREAYHPRLAILPIGAYLPRFPMKYYHLSPDEAVEAARALEVQSVIPCHFGTFVLALDRPAAALPRFAHSARRGHVAWTMPRLLLDESELIR